VPRDVFAADLDGDGDADVLSASLNTTTRLPWYENLGDWCTSATQQVITVEADRARQRVCLGPGWRRRCGRPLRVGIRQQDRLVRKPRRRQLRQPQLVITTEAIHAQDVYATDLDGDGDTDVLSALHYYGRIVWYENLGEWCIWQATDYHEGV
jgi:hypothetical protein